MAIVVTPVVSGSGILPPGSAQYKSWTVTALDADTTLAFPHGFKQSPPSGNPSTGVAPDYCVIQALVSYANAALPNWGVAVDSTNITLTKTNATASGGTTP